MAKDKLSSKTSIKHKNEKLPTPEEKRVAVASRVHTPLLTLVEPVLHHNLRGEIG